jgi:hypothetical protein
MALGTLGRNSALIRKAQDCVILLGPETAAPLTALTTGSGAALVDFATTYSTYVSLGRHTKDDGLTWSHDVNTEDTMSHGVSTPTRRDKTTDVLTLQVALQESKRATFELATGVDLAATTPTAVTGEVSWVKPVTPATIYYRLIALASDGVGTSQYFYARSLPRVSVTNVDDENWSDGEERRTTITFTANVDDVLGYDVKEFWGGPGFRTNLVAMGFPALGS